MTRAIFQQSSVIAVRYCTLNRKPNPNLSYLTQSTRILHERYIHEPSLLKVFFVSIPVLKEWQFENDHHYLYISD